ncbi:hypothetical protein ABC347_12020 [Sphingomonas sp. 1P06PA]|uniref:hypothetical protein n=1 Tax=Sphingomonas sp. 1P06PA TaxID=554121 RepID=UPI0039A5533F
MLAEGLWLIARDRTRAGDVVAMLLPGALMIIGLRSALTGAPWPAIALPLALSLPAHVIDLRRRRSISSASSDRR